MKRTTVIAALIGVLVIAALLWRERASQRAEDAVEPDANAGAGAHAMPGGSAKGSTTTDVAGGSSARPAPAEGQPSNAALQQAPADAALRVGAAEAKRLRGAILAAMGASPSAELAAQERRDAATPVPALDRKYIRAAIGDIAPLIQECFELGRQARPELREARAVVHFSIIGDAKLGGVVEESKLDDSSEGMTPELSECVRETMYSLKLPAPEGQGRVEVTYPFLMSTAASDPKAAADSKRPTQ